MRLFEESQMTPGADPKLTANSAGVQKFFAYASERYEIFLRRKAGAQPPFTNDPVLRDQRFCNVFREHDTVTRWLAEHLRTPLDNSPKLLQAVVIARWFNFIPTLQTLAGGESLFENWSSQEAIARLKGQDKIFTGAYMIASPKGCTKLEGVCRFIDAFTRQAGELQAGIADQSPPSLEESWRLVRDSVEGLGDFMAYEIITDLRHTSLLNTAHDIHTWANPGPGAARGASRLLELDKDAIKQTEKARLNGIMRQLLDLSKNAALWRKDWPRWEMREVEHTLCEFDKYQRCLSGEGSTRQKFRPNPSNGGTDLTPLEQALSPA